ncbi:MAG TPA: cytochrome P450, partial [Thermoanaerobaculia bacterium]|nr:cytochrome P450 [Thermoanaerobaculia bacterium]
MNAALAALLRNPYPLYALMRRVAPVFHDRRHKLWVLFRFDDVRAVLNDPQTFSSRAAPPGGKPLDWLIFLDPPLHSKLRGLVMRSFTPQAIAGLAPLIEARVDALLDAVRARGEMDVVADFAEPLPLMVIADLLGLPPADAIGPRLRRWTDAILHLGDAIAGGEIAARAIANFGAAKEEMRPYVLDLVAQRRVQPANDLLSRLVAAEVDGERLTDDDILGFFYLLLLAGSETTTNLLGNAVLSLLKHPRELQRPRENPELLGSTIEEVLRYRSPVQLVFRTTTRDVTLRGKTIRAGSLVLAMIGSANRDAHQFARANAFDITRSPSHIAFGHGAHFCIGAMLARLEAKIALPRLLAL